MLELVVGFILLVLFVINIMFIIMYIGHIIDTNSFKPYRSEYFRVKHLIFIFVLPALIFGALFAGTVILCEKFVDMVAYSTSDFLNKPLFKKGDK